MPIASNLAIRHNNITFSGYFNKDLLLRSSIELETIISQGHKSINIDLKDLTKCFASAILPFAVNCRALLLSGIDIRLELPSDPQLSRLFKNCNWAHLIDPRQYDPSDFESAYHVPALTYRNAQEHLVVVDQIVDRLLASLPGFTRDQLAALEWAINEITDNVLNHARSSVGGVVQFTAMKNSKMVEFVVCDSGDTIPGTLRETHQHITSDAEALDRAIREGVTRNSATNMGNGLFGSYRLAQLSEGFFSIYSRHAYLEFNPKKKGMHVQSQAVPYRGALIVCAINTTNPGILEEALSFRGERHTPAYTYVDRLTQNDVVKIVLRSECRSFGSREVARPIRTKMMNLISASRAPIEVVLDDVPLISSSFADEVFGKLFAELGPISFMARIQLVGGNKVVRQLIDRAITQRLALVGRS